MEAGSFLFQSVILSFYVSRLHFYYFFDKTLASFAFCALTPYTSVAPSLPMRVSPFVLSVFLLCPQTSFLFHCPPCRAALPLLYTTPSCRHLSPPSFILISSLLSPHLFSPHLLIFVSLSPLPHLLFSHHVSPLSTSHSCARLPPRPPLWTLDPSRLFSTLRLPQPLRPTIPLLLLLLSSSPNASVSRIPSLDFGLL